MQPVIPISLIRIAVKRMQDVETGRLSHQAAKEDLHKVCDPNRPALIAYLTENYSQDVQAFQYFGLL